MKKISTIITTYCGSDNLDRAIQSVLNQQYDNIEVIVIDDNYQNSIERIRTEKLMEKYEKDERIRYIKHAQNKNGSAARNTGLKNAYGDYVQFLDDDDYLFPNRFRLCVNALEKNPECRMVVTGTIAYGTVGVADLSGAKVESNEYLVSKEWIYRFNALGTGSNIFATLSSIYEISGFDETYDRMQDIEFVFRYCNNFKVCSIPDRTIIKALNNRPAKINSYIKYKGITDKFIGQFKEDIYKLVGKKDGDKWICDQYASLFRVALSEGNPDFMKEARENLEHYRRLSVGEKVKYAFPEIWKKIKNNKMLRKMVTTRKEGTGNLEAKLTVEERKHLDFFIANWY